MRTCSKRRKTKHPFCKDDPNCYWDKYCKSRRRRRISNKESKKLTKLDIISKKISKIEGTLKIIEKKMSKSSKRNKKLLSSLKRKGRNKYSVKSNNTTYLNKVEKLKKNMNELYDKNKTGNRLMKQINKTYDLSNSKQNTISPEGRQMIRDL